MWLSVSYVILCNIEFCCVCVYWFVVVFCRMRVNYLVKVKEIDGNIIFMF